MSEKYIFPDTNIFLHYPQVDHVDWPLHLQASKVILVVAPIVIRELNKHKDDSNSTKIIRERAAKTLKVLRGFSRTNVPFEIRDSVELRFQPSDPQIDFSLYGLVRDLGDDFLVATVLEFRQYNPNTEILIATDDLGLELKSKLHQILTFQLPEELKLPEEINADQKRIRELEAKIRQFESRSPKLGLVFPTGQILDKFSVKTPMVVPPEVLTKHVDRIRGKYPQMEIRKNPQNPLPILMEFARLAEIQPEHIENYNRQLELFYVNWQTYLEGVRDFVNHRRRTFTLDIKLINDGTAPAEDIDIYMHFPDGPQLIEEFPMRPTRPRPPAPPETPFESMQKTFNSWSLAQQFLSPNIPILGPPSHRNVQRLSIKKTHSYEIRDHVDNLKHKFAVPLEPIKLDFPSFDQIKSFSISYTILASNSPTTQEGNLNVVFEK